MAFVTNVCDACGETYEYDEEASPEFCDIYCSQGCAESLSRTDDMDMRGE